MRAVVRARLPGQILKCVVSLDFVTSVRQSMAAAAGLGHVTSGWVPSSQLTATPAHALQSSMFGQYQPALSSVPFVHPLQISSSSRNVFQQPATMNSRASLPQAKDYSQPLFVDTSVEYEIPKEAFPPKDSKPLLIVHPQHYEFRRHRRQQNGSCACHLCRFYERRPHTHRSSDLSSTTAPGHQHTPFSLSARHCFSSQRQGRSSGRTSRPSTIHPASTTAAISSTNGRPGLQHDSLLQTSFQQCSASFRPAAAALTSSTASLVSSDQLSRCGAVGGQLAGVEMMLAAMSSSNNTGVMTAAASSAITQHHHRLQQHGPTVSPLMRFSCMLDSYRYELKQHTGAATVTAPSFGRHLLPGATTTSNIISSIGSSNCEAEDSGYSSVEPDPSIASGIAPESCLIQHTGDPVAKLPHRLQQNVSDRRQLQQYSTSIAALKRSRLSTITEEDPGPAAKRSYHLAESHLAAVNLR